MKRDEKIDAWRERLKTGQSTLAAAFGRRPDTRRFLRGRSLLIDKLLKDIWLDFSPSPDWALIAVGGYGRGVLYPASDVDLLIVVPHPSGEAEKELLAELLGIFWDVGLEISHSVRTVDECLIEAARDITVETTLLEARPIAGDPQRFDELNKAMQSRLDAQLFFKAKYAEQTERHIHYQDTAYSLEPNCKESPGGLRDLHVILWLARAAGIGNDWKALEEHGLLTHSERLRIERCEKKLDELRIRLHLIAGRREDRLLFDYQNALARQLGMSDNTRKRASEQLMHRYYQNAFAASQITTILLQNIGTLVFPAHGQLFEHLANGFQKVGMLLDVVDEQIFQRCPTAILEAFRQMQLHPELRGMTARTLRALWRARLLIDGAFRKAPENKACFLALLQSKHGVIHEFRRMNQYGILGRYLPAFGRIVGQMQHDLFHVFTVDQHILQVLRNLRRLTIPEFAHEYPLPSRLIADFDKPWLLYIAALFHDIAKGRGGDHSILGARDARRFCQQHGLLPEDTELVYWLVKEHLTLSSFAQKNDNSDPKVIAAFAALVGDERHLTALYLLTVADIRGTSPKVWSAWKSKLLEELFVNTLRHLQDGGAPAAHGVIRDRQEEALHLLRNFALPDAIRGRLWQLLDTVYFLRHEAEEIAWHTRNLHYRVYDDTSIVKVRHEPDGIGLQVMVYTRQQSKLFVRLAAYFARAGFSIADAKIHTTAHGYALDSFMIFGIDEYRGTEAIAAIEHELPERLHLQSPPEEPPRIRPSRQVRHMPISPQVTVESDERRDHFVLTIVAADRPGLLFTVANVLASHAVTLHTAKITTLGERAEDVFLLSGQKLNHIAERLRLEADILSSLKL